MITVRDQLANSAFTRLVGAAFGIIGLALGSLAAFIVWRLLESRGSIETSVAVLLIVLVPIAWFCASTGWRLALNKPNRYGSIIRPWAWRTLAGIFLLLAITMLVVASLDAELLAAWPALGAVAFALLCWRRAQMLGRLVKPELLPYTTLERTRER